MNKKSLQSQLNQVWQSILHLRLVLFILLLATLYGFIAWRISTLATAEPDVATVELKASKTSTPRIDPAIVDKIKQLEDNSINVQALFDEARKNPFRE